MSQTMCAHMNKWIKKFKKKNARLQLLVSESVIKQCSYTVYNEIVYFLAMHMIPSSFQILKK
jgi:hypothetical protein